MKEFTLIDADGREFQLKPERILSNDVIFPGEFNPHNIRLWIIGNEYGALCAVWASHEQDAFDESCDNGLLDGLAIEEKDATEETVRLGNADESFNLDNAWIKVCPLEKQSLVLMLAFAEARGACADNLDKI